MDTQTRGDDGGLIHSLHRSGRNRWLLLGMSGAIMVWLAMFAGHVRHDGHAKRPWAVNASRVLIGAGAIVLARLLLYSNEGRVPVIYIDQGRLRAKGVSTATLPRAIDDLKAMGYALVPVSDVVRYVREGRYVPKKSFAVVIEFDSADTLVSEAAVLSHLEVAALVGSDALGSAAGGMSGLPQALTLGIRLRSETAPGVEDSPWLETALKSSAERLASLAGRSPRYALTETTPGEHPSRILKASGYECFLDGRGYNRHGDNDCFVRLMDATALVDSEKAAARRLDVLMSLFVGKYYRWPLVARGSWRGGRT